MFKLLESDTEFNPKRSKHRLTWQNHKCSSVLYVCDDVVVEETEL